jgi:hypothetical protein
VADGELEIVIVIGLAAFIMSSYFLGRSLNYRKQRIYYRLLAEEVKPFAKTLTYRGFGPSAFSYAFPPLSRKDSPFRKLEASITLLDRESIIHYAYSKLRGQSDRTIVKADLQSKPSLSFEMFSKTKAAYRLAKKSPAEGLRTLRNSEMSDQFLLRSTNPELAEKLRSTMLRTVRFEQVRPYIEHFSLSSESPHLVLSYINAGRYTGLFRFLWEYAKLINPVFSSGSGPRPGKVR